MCGLLAACFNGERGGWFLRVVAYSCRSAWPGAHCIPALSSPLLSTRKQSTAPRTRRLSRPSSCSLANTQPVHPCWRACTHTHTHTHTHTLLLRVNIDCLASHFVLRTRFPFLSHIIFYFSLSSLGYLGSISGATLGMEVAAS